MKHLNRYGFSLVEVMIAVVLSTMISYFLFQIMSTMQTKSSEMGGLVAATRDASLVLQRIKNLIRGTKKLSISENVLQEEPEGGGLGFFLQLDPNKHSLILQNGEDSRELGRGNVHGFSVSPFSAEYPHIYRVDLQWKNPESGVKSGEDTLNFSALVSQRIPEGNRISDPFWVPNSENCPPDCPKQGK